jgi:hypothetical protein
MMSLTIFRKSRDYTTTGGGVQDFVGISESFNFLFGSAAGFMALLAFTALALIEVDPGPPGRWTSRFDCVRGPAVFA